MTVNTAAAAAASAAAAAAAAAAVLLLQCGGRLYLSESDVCRRQILTTKVDPRTVRVKL